MAENKKDVMDEELKKENKAAEAESKAAENTQEQEAQNEEETKEAAEGNEAEDSEEKDSEEKDSEEKDSEEKDSKDKGLFGKKKKKDKKDEQIEDLNDRLRRQMAEFDNFRKRSEKEKSQMFDMGARSIIEKVLPVVDNFERGLAAVPEDQKDDAFVTGMDKVYKQLMTEFDSIGVKPIEALGQEFNPDLHNAVMQVESDEYEPGVVAQELQKGYMYKDTVVRHSMVAVVSE
ncbi:MAG: nucleotide exchange factor GrpE [Lachnobacterium sp.]|nr:nucleotide exchange factor GrpE [Lachnobacterium sp.]MDY5461170.1 nucleotide exchange factor GrpE [Agathobacter sp.]MCI7087660.1 nucleotide exchange factor GrpE [Lachnobacterium sp.]MCI7104680.1 nucleotide exchange factor GrpE [Lachnobacterium sp.]MCI7531728.1 nucleotide exchange factor GrpE [Lachnobacterium sp.]